MERLGSSKCAAWKNNKRPLLRMVHAWNIVEGWEQLPPLPPGGLASQTAMAVAARARREDFEVHRVEAAGIIYNACLPPVRIFIDGIDIPADMWLTLAEQLDTASTAIGRQALNQKLMTLKSVKGKPIGEYLSNLLEIRNQITGTPEEICDIASQTHIFTSLPAVFDMTLKIQQYRPDATIESIIEHNLPATFKVVKAVVDSRPHSTAENLPQHHPRG